MVERYDYLVVGAGASAMAFVDSVFHETDATFAIVDRRDAPGGHWNDAYPFVRLHQPAVTYGVPSRPLGSLDLEPLGVNCGFLPLSSGPEVLAHYQGFMHDTLLTSGRVTYLPSSEHRGGGEVVSLLSGDTTHIDAARLVDATMMETRVPSRHRPSFGVDDDVIRVPPNELPRRASDHRHFIVVGAGKTGIDAVCWLMANGATNAQVTWIVPRDQWLTNRALIQPGADLLDTTARLVGAMYDAIAAAESVEDLELRMEAAGVWMRLTSEVRPTMMHGAGISAGELDMCRRVGDVVRLGHLVAVHDGELAMEQGTHQIPQGSLVVDCSASALAHNVGVVEPVFTPERIALQMIRQFQPCFSSALIGHIEATIPDDQQRDELTQAAPMSDTVSDWITGLARTMANERAWRATPEIALWLAECRLDPTYYLATAGIDPDERAAAVKTMTTHMRAAAQNLARLQAL